MPPRRPTWFMPFDDCIVYILQREKMATITQWRRHHHDTSAPDKGHSVASEP